MSLPFACREKASGMTVVNTANTRSKARDILIGMVGCGWLNSGN